MSKRGAQRTRYKREEVSLREYMDMRLDAIEATAAKTEKTQDTYNTTHNNLTRKIDDAAALLMPRAEYTVQHESLKLLIDNAREEIAQLRGVQRVLLLCIGAFLTVQLFLVAAFIQHITGH
jgi:hypothetical protein